MRKIFGMTLIVFAFPILGLADDWSGKLLDSACYDRQIQQKSPAAKAAEACIANSQTTAFALEASGKVFKLDATGNSQAMAALKNRADRVVPGKQQSGEIMAKVSGTETGGTIKVDAFNLQ